MTADVAPILDRFAEFRGRSYRVTALPGGLTNRNFRVDVDGCSYVVRVAADDVNALAIDRENEYRNSVIAASSGVGAEVIGHLPGEGVLVLRYIEGRTLADADLREPGRLARVAGTCRRLHAGPRFANDFDMVEVRRSYLRIIQNNGYRLPPHYLDYEDHLARLSGALRVRRTATVPCHNDLLAANQLDDGTTVRLIDYEYAGNNDPCFELGNMWSECHLDDVHLEELVTAYFGRTHRVLVARTRMQALMSQYGWTLWGAIQSAASPLDFDFWTWAIERFEAAAETFRSRNFEELLAEATKDD
jgi:thiamine kinase-like enzyme